MINGVTALVVLVLLARLNALLAGMVVVMAVPLVFILRILQRRYSEASRKVQDDTGDLATQVEEGATGIRAIKSFGRRPYVNARFDRQARVLHDSSMARVRLIIHFEWVLNVLPGIAFAAVLLIGAFAVGSGSMTLGGLVAFVSYLLMIIWPIESLGWILGMAEEAATAAERVFEVFDSDPRVQDPAQPRELGHVAGKVRFEAVDFRYPGYGEWILRDVNLEIEPGETVALVGLTGSGKTTLAMLVPRLYDVTNGRVTIDGVDVRDATLRSLRRQVAVGFEEATLFSASVRENVSLGNADATDQEVDDALLVAQAQFVHDLPWGLDTRIGEQGMTLSGGQRQRIALGPGDPGAATGDRARRPALRARRPHREARRGGAAPRARRRDRAHRGPPAVDRRAGRPVGPAVGRHDRGGRDPHRAARRRALQGDPLPGGRRARGPRGPRRRGSRVTS